MEPLLFAEQEGAVGNCEDFPGVWIPETLKSYNLELQSTDLETTATGLVPGQKLALTAGSPPVTSHSWLHDSSFLVTRTSVDVILIVMFHAQGVTQFMCQQFSPGRQATSWGDIIAKAEPSVLQAEPLWAIPFPSPFPVR